MNIIIALLIIFNLLILPVSTPKEGIPIDTSEDILSEGISDPEWIVKR